MLDSTYVLLASGTIVVLVLDRSEKVHVENTAEERLLLSSELGVHASSIVGWCEGRGGGDTGGDDGN